MKSIYSDKKENFSQVAKKKATATEYYIILYDCL